MDSKKSSIAQCRFWPEIHEVAEDIFSGAMVPIRPHKIEVVLNNRQELAWCQLPLDLCKTFMHGPFDFSHENDKGSLEKHHIPVDV